VLGVLGLQGVGVIQDGQDCLARGLDGGGMTGTPTAEEAFNGDADVGGAQ
jgi:hypothetical protein